MTNPKNGGPAFPTRGAFPTNGMSLRDYFAGQALAGLTVGCAGLLGHDADGRASFSAYAKGDCNAVLADRAYALADAMIAARVKETNDV